MSLLCLRTWVFRFALMAVLFASLAPSLSSLIAAAGSSASWVEVCTTLGAKMVQVEDAGEPAHDGLHAGDHCPYCRLPQDLPAIAHAPGVLVLADGSVRGVPQPPALTPPLEAAVWPAHRSRAPPSFS
ncbi:hypothetical protein D9M72_513480 [compost metagenome]